MGSRMGHGGSDRDAERCNGNEESFANHEKCTFKKLASIARQGITKTMMLVLTITLVVGLVAVDVVDYFKNRPKGALL